MTILIYVDTCMGLREAEREKALAAPIFKFMYIHIGINICFI
jgi:hypothetical protein